MRQTLKTAHTQNTITICVQAIRQTRYALLRQCIPGLCRAHSLLIQPLQTQNLQAVPEPTALCIHKPASSCLASSKSARQNPGNPACLGLRLLLAHLTWQCPEPSRSLPGTPTDRERELWLPQVCLSTRPVFLALVALANAGATSPEPLTQSHYPNTWVFLSSCLC
jgi:hypothetical protein